MHTVYIWPRHYDLGQPCTKPYDCMHFYLGQPHSYSVFTSVLVNHVASASNCEDMIEHITGKRYIYVCFSVYSTYVLEEEKRILENILLNFVKLGIMMYSYHPGASTSPMVSIQLTMARRYDLGQPQSYMHGTFRYESFRFSNAQNTELKIYGLNYYVNPYELPKIAHSFPLYTFHLSKPMIVNISEPCFLIGFLEKKKQGKQYARSLEGE